MSDETPASGAAETAKPAPKPRTPKAKPKSDAPASGSKEDASPAAPSAESPAPAEAPTEKPAKPKKPAKAAAAPKTAPPAPAQLEAPEVDVPPGATIVDATGLVLGRAASLIAKRLLNGETVVVVNAEKSLVTGNRRMVIEEFTADRARGSVRSGPHYPRYPDRIFRRTVRGMLPHQKTRGDLAFHRLQVYMGVPTGLSGRPHADLSLAKARPALRTPMTLGEISRLLGARV